MKAAPPGTWGRCRGLGSGSLVRGCIWCTRLVKNDQDRVPGNGKGCMCVHGGG